MKYTLKTPITVGSETISELTLRESVCAGDMRGIKIRQEMDWDDVIKLTSRLSGHPPSTIEKLQFMDIAELSGLVADFLQGGRETGTSA